MGARVATVFHTALGLALEMAAMELGLVLHNTALQQHLLVLHSLQHSRHHFLLPLFLPEMAWARLLQSTKQPLLV